MSSTLATPAPVRIGQPTAPAAATAAADPAATVTVCTGKACCRKGAETLLENLKATAPPDVFVCSRGCMGKCREAPVMAVTTPATDVEIAQKTVMKVRIHPTRPHSEGRVSYTTSVAL